MTQRPRDVSPQATFNASEREWELGERRGNLQVGDWSWWREDGSLVGKSSFDSKGRLHGVARRFHPDGAISMESRYAHGARWGKTWHTRSRSGDSPEDAHMAQLPPGVHRIEMVYMNDAAVPMMTAALGGAGRDEPPELRVGSFLSIERDLPKYLPGSAFMVLGGVTDIADQQHDVRVLFFDGPATEDYSILRFAFAPPGSRDGTKPKWQDPAYGTAIAVAEVRRKLFVAVDAIDNLVIDAQMPVKWGLRMEFPKREARVGGFEEGGLAKQSALRVGDVIVEANGTRVDSPISYLAAIREANIARELTLHVNRGGDLQSVVLREPRGGHDRV